MMSWTTHLIDCQPIGARGFVIPDFVVVVVVKIAANTLRGKKTPQ